jgi:hypothetical protein
MSINKEKLIEILSVSLVVFIAYVLLLNNAQGLKDFNNGDVHRGFQRGISILNHVNPYLEFNPNNMLTQEKVPGFFPLYFYLMAVIAKISNYSFVLFLDNLRYLVFTSYASIGVTIYLLLRKQGKSAALLAMMVFMFNSWTVGNIIDLKQDSYVCFLLLLSLVNLKKRNTLAFLLYGIAVALKHLSVLVFPIYLIELIRFLRSGEESRKKLKQAIILTFVFLIPIVIPSITYVINTPKNFFYSIMFQVTRVPESTAIGTGSGFNKILVLYSEDKNNSPIYYMLPRLPMIVLLLLLNIVFLCGKINLWKYAAFTYLIFIGFNSVLFGQYYVWMFAFVPLGLLKIDS